MHVPSGDLFLDNKNTALVVGSTVILTVALLGVVALLTGQVSGQNTRLPVYVLGASVLFVVLVFRFERKGFNGRLIIISTVGLTAVGLLVLFLMGEGLVYVVLHPDQILASQLIFYLVAAGVVVTGLVYWGLSHWREFVSL